MFGHRAKIAAMIPSERGIRMRLVAAARRLHSLGANAGTAGNLSARADHGYIITPSGMAYDRMHPEDLVYMGQDWTHGGGQRVPSSEWRLHRDVYASDPDIQAVVHTHSPQATALACLAMPIPAFHYEVALAGGPDIRCAPYSTFGTQALSDGAVAALRGRRACLLAQHGVLATGASLEAAVSIAEKVEYLAGVYATALRLGTPRILDDEEMKRVAAQYALMPR